MVQPALAALPFRNQQLFSDHYLTTVLAERHEWGALKTDAALVMARVAALFAAYAPSDNEAQIEHDLIRPIFDLLGHEGHFEIQPALRTPDGTKKPDYVFYRDRAMLTANKDKTLTDDLLRGHAYAVADAKYWGRPLDVAVKTKGGDPFTNKNPSYQIAFYIQHSGVEWGILTNGRLWRLYHKESAYKLDRYYEVDLKDLADAGDVSRFLSFYGFFRRAAFEDSNIGLDAIVKASADYAQAVGDSLKVQVYDALRHIAQGFLDYSRNGLTADDPATLKEIYDNSLILLYRLLFALYAEARNLLPRDDSQEYRDIYSLYALTHTIERDLTAGRIPQPGTAILWPRLATLFDIINRGNPPLKVATFNGGLFDPAKHPFLEHHTVGDARLQAAVDKLARVNGHFVDYRDLAERHLGTIYEVLLEFHLKPSDAEEGWTITVENDKGERHATGSYYTPDYIVKYIVEQTVGPILDNACEAASDSAAKVAAVLAVNVLDPAMGSGHFLVEATEFIARYLTALEPPEGAEVPDVAYWKRRVVQACIYGVDLNPLAVELAKLSLWLATVANDRPLSFLDHHLRCGNALLGARLEDLNTGIGGQRKGTTQAKKGAQGQQPSLADDTFFQQSLTGAIARIEQIEASPAQTVGEVKEQEKLYAELRTALTQKYGQAADAKMGTYFGLDFPPTIWNSFRDWLTKGGTIPLPEFLKWQEAAAGIATQRRFFHWDLEFPEVFFDARGQTKGPQAGFDAVIGNPPWIRQESFAADKPALKERFAVFTSIADLSSYFVELGNVLIRQGGRFGFIIPNKFVRANYGRAVRAFLTSHVRIERLIDFNDLPIFPGAVTYPMIVLTEKEPQTQSDVRYTSLHTMPTADLAASITKNEILLPPTAFTAEGWRLGTAELQTVLDKLTAKSVRLIDYENITIFYGIKTGYNKAFYIDRATRDRLVKEDPKSAEIIKPNLVGADVKRYDVADTQHSIILTKIGVPIDRYPAVFAHLQQYQAELEARYDKGKHWWELRACDYYDTFEQPKIVYPNICVRPEFAYDEDGFYSNQKTFIMPTDDKYLLAILNSRVMHFIFEMTMPKLRGGFYEPGYVFMRNVPIRQIAFTTPVEKRRRLREDAIALCGSGNEDALLAFVAARLVDTPEQSDVVHDVLAHLAQRMLGLHTDRRVARNAFRGWLRDTQGLRLDTFSPKTFLDSFDERTYAEFAAWMKRNRHEISYSDDRTYREAFTRAGTEVREVKTRIANTDRLIDRIVYALYGLTEDEIAIVEGHAGSEEGLDRCDE